ncbi:hypothetical protein IC621_13635 [Bacillus sp. IB182487]|uniref:Uncharacterized protein n=2 Tax=Metabacillus arenae TaxID=2771434 RepID=A0A926NNY4_9BACI|nr:hypothetical protein [Metabacillus arenae]
MALAIVTLLILAGGLIFTLKMGKVVSARKSEYDTQLNEKIQEHPYLRNPIFIAYLVAAVIFVGFVLYFAWSHNY